MKPLPGAIVITLFAAAAATAGGFAYMTGNSYRDLPSNQQAAYVRGVIDGLFSARENPDGYLLINECLKKHGEGLTSAQMSEMANRWLDSHPEALIKPMPAAIILGVTRYCQG